MGRMTGKVAFVTGAARGQGRSHALTLAREGADIVGRRLLRPQAVSNAVLYLASDESSDVTGLELAVDAGHLIMPGIELD